MNEKLTALGADIFAGLFTRGVKDAGYRVLAHLEHGPYGVESAKLNFPDLEVRVGRGEWRERDFRGKVDLMYNNPPCAVWSAARGGRGAGPWEEDPRLRCWFDCVEAGLAVRPKAWACESVTQAWSNGQPFIVNQAEKWCDAGYHCTLLIEDNQYLGAPQVRKRIFLIAHRHPLVWPRLTQPTTVRQLLADLAHRPAPTQDISGGETMPPLWKQRLWKMSARYGGYFAHAYHEEGRGPRNLAGRIPSAMVRRLLPDQPAPVMIAAHLRLHPTECRFLDWKEWLALCGLPHTWRSSSNSLTHASQELARAVLPPVGRWIATAVRDGLKLPALRTAPGLRLVDLRKPDAPVDRWLWTYQGPTVKNFVPPELPAAPPPRISRPPCPDCGGKPISGDAACPTCGRSARSRPPGSGARTRELLLAGKLSTEEILQVIRREFPGSKATGADVSWNRGKLRRAGLLPA